jgi:hypothetical protein
MQDQKRTRQTARVVRVGVLTAIVRTADELYGVLGTK